MKKFVSILLVVMMIIAMLPATVFAAETATATLSFASTDQRTSFSTTAQIWEQNGVKLTNNKGSSTSNVANYANPVRLYANSEVIVEFASTMTKIEFTCNAAKYATALQTSIGDAATVSGSVVTVEPNSTTFSVTLTGQVRLNSLTVTYEVGGDAVECEHAETVEVAEIAATCTAAGYTAGVQCVACEAYTSGHEVIPATGHTMADWETVAEANCTEAGEQTRGCENCDLTETQAVAALGHTYADGACTVCGAEALDVSLATSIAVGDTVYIVYEDEDKTVQLTGISTTGTKYGTYAAYNTIPADEMPLVVVAGNSEGSVAFQTADGTYLTWTSGNSLNVAADLSDNTSWTVTFDEEGNALIANVAGVEETRMLQWNNSADQERFATYKNTQKSVQLYKVNVEEQVNEHDLTYYAAVEATCHQPGIAEYWYCAECDIYFADAEATQQTNIKNLITEEATPLTYVEAVEAGLHTPGCAEYWYCETCDAVFSDAAGTQLTNRKNLVIVAEHELAYEAAVEATCHQPGLAEYWYCATCDAYFADANGIQLTNLKNLITEEATPLTYVEAVEAGLHTNGCAEYWYCETCMAVFADAAGTQLTNVKNLVIVAEHELAYVEAVAAGLHQPGVSAYWYCETCDAFFTDANGQYLTNYKNLITAEAEHPLTYVAATEAVCHQPGIAEYWYCATCDAYFADANGIQMTNLKNLIVEEATPLTYVEAVEAGLHTNGCQEYWYCEECLAVFADAQGTVLTNVKNLVIVAEHELAYVEAIEAGLHQSGVSAYWYCETCDAFFTDANGQYLTNYKNLITAEAEHPLTYVAAVEAGLHQPGVAEYWYCATCDAFFADANGIQLTNYKNLLNGEAEHPLTYVAAVEATCHQPGLAEYWYCATCDAYFADANGIQLTNLKNLITEEATPLTYVEAVEAGLHTNGCAEYWYCEECLAVFADAQGTVLTNVKNLVIVAEHELAYVEAIEAGLHQSGVSAYWYCETCDAFFTDANGQYLTNYKNLITAEAEHPLTYVAAVEATCHQPGIAEYWYCGTCDAYFADANGIQMTNLKNLITEEATPLTYVAAVEPTYESNGCQEYWYCETCEAVFADAQGTILTNRMNLTIPMLTKIEITAQPENVTGLINSTVTMTVNAEGVGLTYKWQYSVNGGNSWWASKSFEGKDTDTLYVPVTAARDGFLYRCVITDVNGNVVVTEAAKLSATTGVSGQPEDVTVSAGETVTFTASVEGVEVVSYKWQYSVNGGKGWWASKSFEGKNTDTLYVPATAARDGFLYRCVITTADGTVIITEPAELNVQ